ncbi:MAG: hypothetical protein O3B01_23785 [Planctomycetota bacterium]|nr:hypothetical protein [Planctomycetota bacterium]MDA1141594.1 hypothetical protein [Planctomycetota bacterium]
MPDFAPLVLLVFWALTSHSFAQDDVASTYTGPQESLHVYLLIGQSNMAGRAPFKADESGSVERCFLLNREDKWEPAKNPLNRYSTIRKGLGMQKMNPGYTFAKKMLAEDKSISIGLVVNAKGGSSIKEWTKGTTFYKEAIRRAGVALKSGSLKGILWHQGESDAKDAHYFPKLKALISDLRSDLGEPGIPFVAGEIQNVKLINDQIRELAGEVPFTGYASSDGLKTMDRWHFDAPSMKLLGQRYAEAMLKIQAVKSTHVSIPKGAPQESPDALKEKDRKARQIHLLSERSDRIGAHIAKIRGLPFRGPVKKGIQNKEELRNYLQELMLRKQPKEKMDALARAYAMLGLMPRGIDLSKVVLDLLQQQVAGFYDPETKALYLINEWNMSQSSIISHELMHALQDQHFDLLSLPMEDEKREDVMNAVRCVVEGEGMLMMFLYVSDKDADVGAFETLLGEGYKSYITALDRGIEMKLDDDSFMSSLGMGGLANVPRVLKESLILPYMAGLVFVHRAWQKGGWQGVNDLYQDMPQSTEQILHIEKYFDEIDRPTVIEIMEPEKLAPEGFNLIYESVLGELYISVLMRDLRGNKASKSAWEGWDGDLYLAFLNPETDTELCIWSTVWDSENDAGEFAEQYRLAESARTSEKPEPGVELAVVLEGSEVFIARGHLPRKSLNELIGRVQKTRVLKEALPIKSKGKVMQEKTKDSALPEGE